MMLLTILALSYPPLPQDCLVGFAHANPDEVIGGTLPGDLAPAVAMDGDLAVVGIPADTTFDGSVTVFRRDTADVWQFEAEIPAPTNARQGFGRCVAVSGNTIVVSSPSAFLGRGVIQTYEFETNGWTLDQQVGALAPDLSHYFGTGLAIDGDTIAVTKYAFSEVSILRRGSSGWALDQQFQLTPSANGAFANHIALKDGLLVIGCPRCAENLVSTSYVYRDTNGTFLLDGVLQADVLPSDIPPSFFGARTAIDGDTIAVGSPTEYAGFIPPILQTGTVRIYQFDGQGWIQTQTLVSPLVGEGALFGQSLALDDGVLAVGAPGHVAPFHDTGIVALYEERSSGFELIGHQSPTVPVANKFFGADITLSGAQLLVAAERVAPLRESVYWFAVAGTPESLGDGYAGTPGLPTLATDGCAIAGAGADLQVAGALPDALGFLACSLNSISAPLFGGTLYVGPPYIGLIAHTVDANGEATFNGGGDPAVLGLEFVVQAGYIDSGAVHGLSLTNGLRLRFRQ